MIQHNGTKENPNREINLSFISACFISAIKKLDISRLLFRCGIRNNGRKFNGESSNGKLTAFEIFQFLLLMIFQGCNLYRYLGSKKQDIACSKSTYHRFLSNEHYNWRRFITIPAARVTVFFDSLTSHNRFKMLILDNSVIARNRSKSVELLAFVFGHVIGKTVRGFNLLMPGRTNGFSFIPIAFNMFSSAKQENALKRPTLRLTSVPTFTKPGYPQLRISRMLPSQ